MAYARIEEGFWTDPKIRSLPIEGKMIAAWLFTNPHRHFSGIYYLPKVLIGEEIGISIGVSEKNLKHLEDIGFLKYSHEFSVVWVINSLRHQIGYHPGGKLSPTQRTGIEKHLRTLHGCPLITEFIKKYHYLKINYDTPINTPTDCKSQSQSQSQSQSKKDIAPPGPSDTAGALPPVLFFSCKFFDVDFDDRIKLAREFPALNDDLLKDEFSKMEDWIKDNKHKKKFKASGHLLNPRSFIKNWLKKAEVDGQIFGTGKPKGFGAVQRFMEKGEENG